MALKTLILTAALAASLTTPAVAESKPNTEAFDLFKTGLNRFCPKRRLDWLNPGIIVDGIDAYLAGLPPETRSDIERRAKPDLAKCEMGAGCGNAAYIRAAFVIGETAHMAQQVCRKTPYTCIAPFECTADE
jgi:hypothetical protein